AQDEVTGQASRFEVHQQKLPHRAVHIFVFNANGALFLQKRSQWKDICPLKWDSSAAGHVNAGEGYDETAQRELQEELGINPAVDFVARIAPCEETGHEFVGLYKASHGGPFRLPPAEIDCGEWFTEAQVVRWVASRPQDFAPGFLKCWDVWQRSRC
ncbi:MAG: NUDIX domain-containing protein, partial [Verrucomicrobia bacterium]|nr:NUDIX domain-containing protein [Verrucomicrobiota bacterium]